MMMRRPRWVGKVALLGWQVNDDAGHGDDGCVYDDRHDVNDGCGNVYDDGDIVASGDAIDNVNGVGVDAGDAGGDGGDGEDGAITQCFYNGDHDAKTKCD